MTLKSIRSHALAWTHVALIALLLGGLVYVQAVPADATGAEIAARAAALP